MTLKMLLSTVFSALALAAGAVPLWAAPTYNNHLPRAAHTHVVEVDGTGFQGDYKDLSEACAWVAAKSPAASAPWTIRLYNAAAHYTETTLTVPAYTTIQGVNDRPGVAGLTGGPVIEMTGVTGNLVTLSAGSALSNVEVYYAADPTAATNLIATTSSSSAVLSNVLVTVTADTDDAFSLDMIESTGTGDLSLFGVSTVRSGTATLTRNVVASSSGTTSVWGGKHDGGTSQAKLVEAGAGTLALYGVALGSATTQLTRTGGTLQVTATPFSTSSGTITGLNVYGATVTGTTLTGTTLITSTHTPATAAEACTAGTVTWDTGFVYVCTASGAWKRAAIATW